MEPLNFATSTDMYVGVYRYVTKSDKMPFIGNVLQKHPGLEIISTTYRRPILANATFRKNRLRLNEHSHQTKQPKPQKIKKSDVELFIINNNIKTGLQLMVATTERRDLGDRSFYDFLIAFRRQARQELIEDAWRFENTKQLIADENVNSIEGLQQNSELQYHCNGQWFLCVQEILTKNRID